MQAKTPTLWGLESEHSYVQPALSDLLMRVFISWGGHGSVVNKYQFPHVVAALSACLLHTNKRQSDQSFFIAVVTQGKIFWFYCDEIWHFVGRLLMLGSSFLEQPWLLTRGMHVPWMPWGQTLWLWPGSVSRPTSEWHCIGPALSSKLQSHFAKLTTCQELLTFWLSPPGEALQTFFPNTQIIKGLPLTPTPISLPRKSLISKKKKRQLARKPK